MTLTQSISTDNTKMRLVVEQLEAIGADVDAALSSAIPRAVRSSRTVMVRATARDLGVAQRSLYQPGRRDKPIQERFGRAAGGRRIVEGHVLVEGGRIPLGEFGARPVWKKTRRKLGKRTFTGRRHAGASYRIGARGRARAAELFAVTFESGKVKVYRRLQKGRSLSTKSGAVDERYGPSVPHAAGNRPEVQRLLDHDAAAFLVKESNSQIDRFIARGRSRA